MKSPRFLKKTVSSLSNLGKSKSSSDLHQIPNASADPADLVAYAKKLPKLHAAVFTGDAAKVRERLEKDKHDVNELDKHGMAPLHYAARGGHTEICALLTESPGFVFLNIKDEEGRTPLHLVRTLERRVVVSPWRGTGVAVCARGDGSPAGGEGRRHQHGGQPRSVATPLCRALLLRAWYR